ncbi:MAG: acyl carrier protein [Oscillospiraceae bacterium]|nr:acyl carrier protein [Oscillospiraceae bacterium]
MDYNEIKAKVNEIYQTVHEQTIDDDDNLFLKCGDSVLHMSFAARIQSEFDVQFTAEEYEHHCTIAKICDLIKDKM